MVRVLPATILVRCSPLRVNTLNAVAVQVMTYLPVDAIPIAMTAVELSCEEHYMQRDTGERAADLREVHSRIRDGECAFMLR